MPHKDINKRREYKRGYYKKNATTAKERVRTRKLIIKKWFQEYRKNLSCSVCGENHPAVIDFHHKNEKQMQVALMVHWGYSIERIEEEIRKCVILCANCHRKIHFKNNNF